MNEYVKKAYDEVSSFLLEDNTNMHIDSIIYDDKTHATYTIATDGNELCYSFDPYSVYEENGYNIVPEWDYNFDYYVYDLLEKGCEIGYMTDEVHYSIWNSINELYPNPDNMTYEQILSLEDQLGSIKKGLSPKEIATLPYFFYNFSLKYQGKEECIICQDKFQNKEKIRILPCEHCFHVQCIDQWLIENKTCPCCKKEIKL